MRRGCSLDDEELDAIALAGSGATCATNCKSDRPNDGLPLSWRAAKEGCGSGGCKAGQLHSNGTAPPAAAPQTCIKCQSRAPQVKL